MLRIDPEIGGVDIVLLGDFNPAIFSPRWFSAHGLMHDGEADAADVQVIHPELTDFTADWLRVQVTKERFVAGTIQAPFAPVEPWGAWRDELDLDGRHGGMTSLKMSQLKPAGRKREWAGRVTTIRDDEFDARLRDLADGERDSATIDMEDISPEDRDNLSVGSLFHFVMGYEKSARGTLSHVWRIVFLEPPRLTERDLKAGEEWADRLRAKWGLD